MGKKPKSVESVRHEIVGAIAEVRDVARAENDESGQMTADFLDDQFAGITDAPTLRAAAANSQALYGGWGSFSDVGTAEPARTSRASCLQGDSAEDRSGCPSAYSCRSITVRAIANIAQQLAATSLHVIPDAVSMDEAPNYTQE